MIDTLLLTILVIAMIAVGGYILLRAREGMMDWLDSEGATRTEREWEQLDESGDWE